MSRLRGMYARTMTSKKVYLEEDDKAIDEWITFKDHKKLPVRRFYQIIEMSRDPNRFDELLEALASYIIEWEITDGVNAKPLAPPHVSDDWKDAITLDKFNQIITAFTGMFEVPKES